MSDLHKTYKVSKGIETRHITGTGRTVKVTSYSLNKRLDSPVTHYTSDGPFLLIYRYYDSEGVMESKVFSAVCDVGPRLVVYTPTKGQAIETLQAMRATLANQED